MPIIEPSSYKAPYLLSYKHIQTIIPSYLRRHEHVAYDREEYIAPDGDPILLDWSCKNSDKLIIISHGLCGHTQRHYVVSFVRGFNDAGWDCVAWNYRGSGDTKTDKIGFTTNDSTNELGWVVDYATKKGNYKKVALVGFSMGGNLNLLYLGRDADKVPPQVIGSYNLCATLDLAASSTKLTSFMGRQYAAHFIKKLDKMMIEKQKLFPDKIDITGIEKVLSIEAFDSRYTAPLFGYASALDYWTKASACFWLDKVKVPSLIINPKNDPFLTGKGYPIEEASKLENIYLEMPDSGGHCGFMQFGEKTWWPLKRALEFLEQQEE